MECEKIKKEIDRLVFDPNPEPDEKIIEHIESCQACREYFRNSLHAAGVMEELRKKKPVLKDPDQITEDILNEIGKYPVNIPDQEQRDTRMNKGLFMLQRLLAAASILLVIVFGIEQYVYLEKLRRLEQGNALASKNVQKLSLIQLSSILETLSPNKKTGKEIIDWKSPGKNKVRLMLLVSVVKNIEGTYPDLIKIVPSGKTKQTSSTGPVLKYFDVKSQKIRK